MEKENKFLKELVKALLLGHIGSLGIISNKSLELELGDCEFKRFLKRFLDQQINNLEQINNLDKHYEQLIDDERKVPDSFYKDLFDDLKNPIKTYEIK